MAGATGALGGAIIAEPAGRGARVALAGRDPSRLAHAARAYPGAPAVRFDAYAPESCARAVRDASAALGGLDALVIASGDPRRPATVVADAVETGAELVRSGPDGTPVVERRAR
ncbi:SDR family NAD(P)-dependent oxidoreductase [Streptomyces coelicoflavus]